MKLIDTTLRESVYYGKSLRNEDGLRYLQLLQENVSPRWLRWVEIGYINNHNAEPLNYCEQYIRRASEILQGNFRMSAMMHIPKSDLTKWAPEVIAKLDLVRVVVGQHVPEELKPYLDYFHNLGVKVSVNLTYAAGMTNEKIVEEIDNAKNLGVDFCYCADSSGSFSPVTTKRISSLLLHHFDPNAVGLHLHNHMQMALANALVAQDCGIPMTDVSVTGAGKGGGNLKMEQAILALFGTEPVTCQTLTGLYRLVVGFSEMIKQDSAPFVQDMFDFLTGLCRLNLKATDALEASTNREPEKYLRAVAADYAPYAVE